MTKTRSIRFRKRRRGGRKTVKRRGGKRRSRVTKRGGRRRSRVSHRRSRGGKRRSRRVRRGGLGESCTTNAQCLGTNPINAMNPDGAGLCVGYSPHSWLDGGQEVMGQCF